MGDTEDNVRKSRRRRLFVRDGRPARFFLHQSIHRESQRQNLRANIEAYGGRIASTDDRVDTVLVSAAYDKDLLRLKYGAHHDKHKRAIHVERLSFVQHCIEYEQFEHRVPIIKGMGGRVGRRRATEFTSSDDEHLCGYIARVQPCKEAGGRSGNQMYKDLVKLGERYPEDYPWVKRHTFHSWRERYKKMQHIFDSIIERMAEAEGTHDTPLWKEDRRMSRRRLRTGGHLEDEGSSEGEEYESQDEEEEDQLREEQGEEYESQDEEEEDQLREEQGKEYEPQGEDQLREKQGEEEGELSPQPEDEYGQEIEVTQDALEGRGIQDVHPDLSEIKKRKRVQPGAVLDHVAKKPRYNISPSYPAKGKGKEIAHESDQGSVSDHEMANTSLFSIDVPSGDFENDEPGPSNVLRSLDRSLTVPPSRSNHQHMDLTQETLVNTQSGMGFEPVSHSTSANRHHSRHSSQPQPLSRTKEDQEQESPPRPRPAQSPPPVQRVAPGTSRNLQDASSIPTATNQPVSRGPKPRSQQEASSAIVQPSDAPYRNTRARSRSVEPVMPPPTLKPARRRKRKPEAAEKEVRKGALAGPTPITETIEEEMDVEHILMTKDANLGTAVRSREPSLETDDAQTRKNLHAASTVSGRPPAAKTYISSRIKALDVVDKFKSSSSSRRYSIPSHQRHPTQNDTALDKNRRRRSEPQLKFGAFKLTQPRTPMNVRRTRLESVSSTESFPLGGTRASAAKKEMQEQEKHTPYKPPQGTRAAQFAGS